MEYPSASKSNCSSDVNDSSKVLSTKKLFICWQNEVGDCVGVNVGLVVGVVEGDTVGGAVGATVGVILVTLFLQSFK